MDTVKFQLGDIVYLKIRPDDAGMVTGIMFRPGIVIYKVTWSFAGECDHYDLELTTEKQYAHETG